MKTWKEFLQHVDARQLDQLFSKAHIATDIVNLYNPRILDNIAVIANLSSGAYGVYNSGENNKIIPPDVEKNLIYYGRINKKNLNNIPKKTLQQYYPNLPSNAIKESDTIHVNVRRIVQEAGNDFEAIMEIASTIIHESVHSNEYQQFGRTSEAGPVAAEHAFMQWVIQNKNMLISKFPQLEGDVVGPKGTLPPGRI